MFILALGLIKSGALSLRVLSEPEGAQGFAASFGLGWILSCAFLSGSPVAAISLGLLAGDVLRSQETYAMIMGSRIGASFVVLTIGFLYDLRSRRSRGGVYVGALALLTTASIYLPALFLGSALMSIRPLEGLSLDWGGGRAGILGHAFDPVLEIASGLLPPWMLALLGVLLILAAFRLFDVALPAVDPTGGKLGQMATTIYRPSVAFLFGMVVTSITLSVSVSLTLLVPLTVRGIVRRENLIPYIMGANITTFIDTLLASFLVGHPDAIPVVICAVGAVAVVSLPVVFLAYRPYERAIDGLATWFTASRLRMSVFTILLFGIPVGLISAAHVGRWL